MRFDVVWPLCVQEKLGHLPLEALELFVHEINARVQERVSNNSGDSGVTVECCVDKCSFYGWARFTTGENENKTPVVFIQDAGCFLIL